MTKRKEVAMLLISFGAICMIAGVLIATLSTLRRGRLSQSRRIRRDAPRQTLEPSGEGDRLNLMGDLPGIGLIVIGAVLIFVGA
ncbi:hypothetical protein [Sphingobium sp. EP60837]|uniref:hypothetical protein n=1 Tax=Sphingobium sp. EP60837 TaxID=1855519 RepID=UPI0012E98488|nr:hypothetical protein [Sphingobium sp. EP60837]